MKPNDICGWIIADSQENSTIKLPLRPTLANVYDFTHTMDDQKKSEMIHIISIIADIEICHQKMVVYILMTSIWIVSSRYREQILQEIHPMHPDVCNLEQWI